jgi:uncharacterized protein YbjQ (UPF0145 family)
MMMSGNARKWGQALALGGALLLLTGTAAVAADVKVSYPLDYAMGLERIKEQFPGNIAFYWGAQPHPPVSKTFGTFKSSKRTNAFGKNREDACAWALASSLLALQDRAEREGGNAVVNIVSNIKDVAEASESEYQCLAGTAMVNVALKGTVVTIAR